MWMLSNLFSTFPQNDFGVHSNNASRKKFQYKKVGNFQKKWGPIDYINSMLYPARLRVILTSAASKKIQMALVSFKLLFLKLLHQG